MTAAHQQRLRSLSEAAHRQGRWLRLWDYPGGGWGEKGGQSIGLGREARSGRVGGSEARGEMRLRTLIYTGSVALVLAFWSASDSR
jgi:hypothetical protein